MPLNRREFLASTAALPVLAGLKGQPAFAESSPHTAPYLALEKFIPPGSDEFVCEKQAAVIRDELTAAFERASLRNEPKVGRSPWPSEYRQIAPDLHEAVYSQSNTNNIQEGWQRWVRSVKRPRRAQFFSASKRHRPVRSRRRRRKRPALLPRRSLANEMGKRRAPRISSA